MGAALIREIKTHMFPTSTPLVPEDQTYERDFAPRDLDYERNFNKRARGRIYGATRSPSLGKRIIRSLLRFFAAILIGAGLALAWQYHGDDAKEIVQTWVPSSAWLLPAANSDTPAEVSASSDLMQQMKLIAVDVAVVRRNIEQLAATQGQLAAKQDQVSQNIAALQAAEEAIREQTLPPPSSSKPIQPRARSSPQTQPQPLSR
jgi:hypothetical protein